MRERSGWGGVRAVFAIGLEGRPEAGKWEQVKPTHGPQAREPKRLELSKLSPTSHRDAEEGSPPIA